MISLILVLRNSIKNFMGDNIIYLRELGLKLILIRNPDIKITVCELPSNLKELRLIEDIYLRQEKNVKFLYEIFEAGKLETKQIQCYNDYIDSLKNCSGQGLVLTVVTEDVKKDKNWRCICSTSNSSVNECNTCGFLRPLQYGISMIIG